MKQKSANNPGPSPHQALSPQTLTPEHSLSCHGPGIKKILLALDLSPGLSRALEYAALCARTFNASLLLLHVVEPAAYSDNYLITGATFEEANQNLLAASHERLLKVKEQSVLHGLKVEVMVRMGRAYSEISDTAKATDSDLIVLGLQGQADRRNLVGTGTADRVIRQASCPVLTVRAE